MPVVPLKQTVTVRKWQNVEVDGWQQEGYGEPVIYPVRATERVEVVVNQFGEEVTASVKLLFDKLPNINYDDEIAFVNELDVAIVRKPLSIKPVRMINGKPTLTAIHL